MLTIGETVLATSSLPFCVVGAGAAQAENTTIVNRQKKLEVHCHRRNDRIISTVRNAIGVAFYGCVLGTCDRCQRWQNGRGPPEIHTHFPVCVPARETP